jgi:deoxyadenosine/deoxycytidine kinase
MHISVEGNIAAGKTTFLSRLNERILARGLNFKFYMEPIEIWTNFNGVNVLEKMYKEPKNYSYLFQTMALTTKINQLYPAIKMGQNFIAERSVMSQFCLFVPSLFENGAITDLELEMLRMQMQSANKYLKMEPDIYIYLNFTPQEAFRRTKKRSRHEESDVTLKYLEQLDFKLNLWMEEESEKTIVVDNNKYLEYDDDYDEILNQLLGKLYSMGKFEELFPGQHVRWDKWDGCFTDGLELGLQVKRKHNRVEPENLGPF